MRKVLIVSPHFPPVNAPDMQRVRLALPHLRGLGWEPIVLSIEPSRVEGAVLEPLLEQTYPSDIQVVRVGGWRHELTRPLKFGSLWWRCGAELRRAGEKILRRERPDLVFFSTTQFDAFTLGPRWLRRYGTPYVLDYQDPWVNDYYRINGVRPPGGPLKFWLSQFTARRREPTVVRQAAGIISVSDAYETELRRRLPDLPPGLTHHLPFGTEPQDFAIALRHPPAEPLVPFGDGRRHLVYTGRCGPDMSAALTMVFRALRRHLDSGAPDAERLRLHFIGTDYAPPPLGRHWALPHAEKEGVLDHVAEHPRRIPYFEALYYAGRADGLLLTGSNDPTYSASKLFPYLTARRPLLIVAHERSLMLEAARAQGIRTSYGFDEQWDRPEILERLVERIRSDWFLAGASVATPRDVDELLDKHSAHAMSARLAAVFDAAAASRSRP